MSLANILVHLDSTARCAARVRIAAEIAARRGARLIGLFAETASAQRVGLVAAWPSADYVEHMEAARAAFAKAAASLGDKAKFIDLNRGGEHEVLARATDVARAFDLVVLGQHEAGSRTPAELAEQIIVESGRPVLMIPSAGEYRHVVTEDVKVMDTLLNEAADHSSDLLVAGAFDHAGFPSLGRGSGTRYLLKHMTQPMLFSH
jgi:nucleotide-binding universal stress UspA family protein